MCVYLVVVGEGVRGKEELRAHVVRPAVAGLAHRPPRDQLVAKGVAAGLGGFRENEREREGERAWSEG